MTTQNNMDDFTKQKVAEQRYKKMREAPRKEYAGDYKSPYYTETKNAAPGPTRIENKEVYSSEYKQDFDKASKDFWQKNTQTGLAKYNGGSMTANFGKDLYTLEELLERVGKFVKESITNELVEKKLPVEELAENFKAVDVALKLLAKSVQAKDDKIDIKNISAYLHGFINTYVDTIVRKKIERDKGITTT